MKFAPPLTSATLIKRYKRFLADVVLEDGSTTTIHCANTGTMTGCAEPGNTVWYSTSDNPKRKYPFSWELSQPDNGDLICVNTARANALVEEAINNEQIPELQGYTRLQRERRYGDENSRIDVFLSGHPELADTYVEVKSVTLLENGHGYFPDAVTTRGQKHLRELIQMRQQGYRAVLLFAVLHSGIKDVQAAAHIDPAYATLLLEAHEAGVEVLAYGACMSSSAMVLDMPLPVILT